MAFFRYPGGKKKLRTKIVETLRGLKGRAEEYREPFFGGGVIGLEFMKENPEIQHAWFNDFDIALAFLWNAVFTRRDLLKEMIRAYTPNVEDFYAFKEELTSLERNSFPTGDDVVKIGFKKLVIHQISYSGLGTKSGGPLGGREQESKYKVDCRWSPEHICRKIDKTWDECRHFDMRSGGCTCTDFQSVVEDDSCKALIYVDPPYYGKGGELYQHSFTDEDHKRLADVLGGSRHRWLLSYDDCPEIRKLYSWATIEMIDVNYTITKARTKGEVLIRN